VSIDRDDITHYLSERKLLRKLAKAAHAERLAAFQTGDIPARKAARTRELAYKTAHASMRRARREK
jgi:hypothetical protein